MSARTKLQAKLRYGYCVLMAVLVALDGWSAWRLRAREGESMDTIRTGRPGSPGTRAE